MEIEVWLASLGLQQYGQAFREHDIDERVLPGLSGEDLREIGVTSVGHRRLLLDAIAELRRDASSEASNASPAPALREITGAGAAERRQLTVLFCDLVGSTELAARLDPEDMGALIRAYQNTVAGEITRFEGHVAKYMGDGVLAYFGWPRAHEDEAERAVRAALAITEAVGHLSNPGGEPLAVRVGIATGLVMVGELIGNGTAQERTVVGETPALAARLQALAEAGEVIIGARTHQLVGGLFELTDLGPRHLKGFGETVRASRVLAPGALQGRFQARQSAGVTPIVGREEELRLLLSRWERAKEGEGQAVLVAGEPGIGKSRLVESLRERLVNEPYVAVGYQCSPHHSQSSLYPVRTRLEQAAGLRRGDSAEAKLEKLEMLLAREMGEASEAVPLLAALAAIPTDGRYAPLNLTPQQQKLKTFAALITHLQRMAARQPVLLVFEDLHWIDPTSLELVQMLVDRLHDVRVLAVLTFRPEWRPSWAGRPHVMLLALNALGRRQIAALAEQTAGGKVLPPEIIEQIIRRTDGVPLFVEELTRSMLEAGLLEDEGNRYALRQPAQSLEIPATLQDLLMARLDRLGSIKDVAQIAACLGREFSYDHLAAVAELPKDELRCALDHLMHSDLILRQGLPPAETYLFHHALVQEAAYASLLKSRRQQLHGRIARMVEEQYPEIAQDHPEWLAHHWTEAGAGSAGSAADNWLRAARRAKQGFSNREAMSHLHKCLEVISLASSGAIDPTAYLNRRRLEALVLLGDLASLAEDLQEAGRCYGQAMEAASEPSVRTWISNKRHHPRAVIRDGAKIAFYEHGGGKQLLLFVPPLAYGLGAFQPILERLCQQFRIITVDPRGSGASHPLTRPYPTAEHVRDTRAVMAALGDQRAIGVGISRGANVILKLAHEEPRLFEKVVTIGAPPAVWEPPWFSEEYLESYRQAFEQGDLENLLRVHTAFACSEPEMLELQELIVRNRLQMPRETLLSFWDPDPTADVLSILAEITVPILVIHGREDRLVSFAAAEELAARLPHAQLYAFEGKGHFPIFTATDEFCAVLSNFVRTGTTTSLPA